MDIERIFDKFDKTDDSVLDELSATDIDYAKLIKDMSDKFDGKALATLSPYALELFAKFVDRIDGTLDTDYHNKHGKKPVPALTDMSEEEIRSARDVLDDMKTRASFIKKDKANKLVADEERMHEIEAEFNKLLADIRSHHREAMKAGFLAGLPKATANNNYKFLLDSPTDFNVDDFSIDKTVYQQMMRDPKFAEIHYRNERLHGTPGKDVDEETKKLYREKGEYTSIYTIEIDYIKGRIAELNEMRAEYAQLKEHADLLREGGEIKGYYESLDPSKESKFTYERDKNAELKQIDERIKSRFDKICGKIKNLEDIKKLSLVDLEILCDKFKEVDSDMLNDVNRARAIAGSDEEAKEILNHINMVNGLYNTANGNVEFTRNQKRALNKQRKDTEQEILKYKYILGLDDIDEIALERFARENGRKAPKLTTEELEHKDQVGKGNATIINRYNQRLALAEEKLKSLLDELNGIELPEELKDDEEETETKGGKKSEKDSKSDSKDEEEGKDKEEGVESKDPEEKKNGEGKTKSSNRKKPKLIGKLHKPVRIFTTLLGLTVAGYALYCTFTGAVGSAVLATLADVGLIGLAKGALVGGAIAGASKKK